MPATPAVASPATTTIEAAAFASRRRRTRRSVVASRLGSGRASFASSSRRPRILVSGSVIVLQLLAQVFDPSRHHRLHGADGAAEDRGRVGLAQILVVAEHDGRSLLGPELQERQPDPLAIAEVGRLGGGGRRLSLEVGAL